ncbi:MAG: hypothetical protein R3244_06460 [Thermoanaerobaculia bacterium]|nr:hypothetical protein [Thermoanaerobaculia bacterium]
MARRVRILLALLLPALSGAGTLLGPHDGAHFEGAPTEPRICAAASHAEPTDHLEASGSRETATCFACLLRLPGAATLAGPARLDREPVVEQRSSVPFVDPSLRPVAARLPSRAPPLA